MDYSKLALLKAEQLQQLQQRGVIKDEDDISRSGTVFNKELGFNEQISICQIEGQGRAGLIVSLALKREDGQQLDGQVGQVLLIVDGKTVISRPVGNSMLFMSPLNLTGKSTVSIKTTFPLTLVFADVMVLGASVQSESVDGLGLALSNQSFAVVVVKEGEIRLSVSKDVPSLITRQLVGFGKKAAITQLLEGGFAVIHIDDEDNKFLTVITEDGAIKSCKQIRLLAQSLCIMPFDKDTLTIGHIYQKNAYVSLLNINDHQPDSTLRLEDAVSIELVRESHPPIVILEKKNGFVIRLPQQEKALNESVKIFVECYYD